MRISVFLSYPKPFLQVQQQFISRITTYLEERGFAPRTLGVTDYDMDAPLTAIRRLMLESNGLITVAFRRTYLEKGITRHRVDVEGLEETSLGETWLTTPWAHIEPAMAYQLGLPILIFRERGVLADGILEKGVVGLYMPEIDLSKDVDSYFKSNEWNGVMGRWEGCVRNVVDAKGRPPSLLQN